MPVVAEFATVPEPPQLGAVGDLPAGGMSSGLFGAPAFSMTQDNPWPFSSQMRDLGQGFDQYPYGPPGGQQDPTPGAVAALVGLPEVAGGWGVGGIGPQSLRAAWTWMSRR